MADGNTGGIPSNITLAASQSVRRNAANDGYEAFTPASYPTGIFVDYIGSTAPSGWLLCNGETIGDASSGATYASAAYETLFGLLDTDFGMTPTNTWANHGTITLPDFRGRVAVHKSADTEFDVLGETGGEKTHTLTALESGLREHNHSINNGTAVWRNATAAEKMAPASGDWNMRQADALTIANSGPNAATDAHNNLQPYMVVNKIIKY